MIKQECKVLGSDEKIKGLDFQSHRVGERRHRRFAGILIGIVSAIVPYRIMTVSHIWKPETSQQSQKDIRKVEDELEVRLKEVKSHNTESEKFQQELTAKLKIQWHKYNELSRRQADSDQSRKMQELLMTQMSIIYQRLQDMFTGFHDHKVVPAYSYLFPENPKVKISPIKHWVAHGCQYRENVLVMLMEVPV